MFQSIHNYAVPVTPVSLVCPGSILHVVTLQTIEWRYKGIAFILQNVAPHTLQEKYLDMIKFPYFLQLFWHFCNCRCLFVLFLCVIKGSQLVGLRACLGFPFFFFFLLVVKNDGEKRARKKKPALELKLLLLTINADIIVITVDTHLSSITEENKVLW